MKRLLGFLLVWLVCTAAHAAPWPSSCIQPITFGQTLTGQLTTSDCWYYYTDYPQDLYYLDMYSFSGTAGQKIYVTMTSPSMDAWLYLYATNDINANPLASDDNGGGGTNARIPAGTGSFTLPATGTYYVSAESADANAAGTGPYTLTLSTEQSPPPPAAGSTVYEFYHPGFNHYFITAYPQEAAKLRAGGTPWVPTGETFNVWTGPAAGIAPVCRFFSDTFAPRSSHFYTVNAPECAVLQTGHVWQLEATDAFYMMPTATGTCPAGTKPLYRLYNNGMSGAPNHRYTVSSAIQATMVAAGWIAEGNGPEGVFACVQGGGGTGSQFQQEVTGYVDTILGIVNGTAFDTDALVTILGSAVGALIQPGGTCPVATTTPPLANLETIPPTLTINVSYGTGCNVPDAGRVSGSAVLTLTNVVFTDNALAGNLSATLNDLRVNGALVANGAVHASANIQINPATEAITGTIAITFTSLQLPTLGLSGTATINLNTAGTTTVSTDLVTSPHNLVVKLNLAIVPQAGAALINSSGASTVGAYAVQVNNVRVDADVCTTGAVGGSISFTQGGQTGTVTFNGNCTYTYSGP